MSDTVLRDLDAFRQALERHPRVLLFKHSPLCPISSTARAEFEMWKLDHPDAPTLFVDVISSRRVARGIAELSGIEHESPQAILFEQGAPVWHASHSAITAGALDAAWAPRC